MAHHIEEPAVETAIESSGKKLRLLSVNPVAYFVRAMTAGLYLALICFLFWTLKQNLGGSPFGAVVASLFFGIGLFVILVTKSELFTSNAMYLTKSTLGRVHGVGQTLKLWGVCYLGNLVGSIAIAFLLDRAQILDALPADHALFHGAEHKIHQSADVIFVKGILANWVVCLAVWVYLNLKEESAKFASIIGIVFIFLYLGFEHSIANMGTFSLALFAEQNNVVTLAGAAHNLLWATLGNIIGGGVFIGALYWWLSHVPAKAEAKEKAALTQATDAAQHRPAE